jgi:hypothetical protein
LLERVGEGPLGIGEHALARAIRAPATSRLTINGDAPPRPRAYVSLWAPSPTSPPWPAP